MRGLLFEPMFAPEAIRAATSERAWLQAMLDAERALAAAEAGVGIVPAEAAAAIAAASRADRFDVDAIAGAARDTANPAEPLVHALAAAVGEEAGRFVHFGATSQDIVDTAAMLVASRTLALILAELDGVAGACAELAARHRDTLVAGRTLMQQALPTTFGLKAAGWLVGVLDARRLLLEVRSHRLAVQLGGAVGTLASLGERGPAVLRAFATELALAEPVVPWHTVRTRIAELGAALDITAGALGKIALDVTLLAQTELGEAREAQAPGRGRSSTMPHKRNPVGCVLATACARQVHALASTLSAGLAQEHERAGGAWQAEWQPLTGALALTGGAAAGVREVLEGLEVDAARMLANLGATDGQVMAEAATFALADRAGRPAAYTLVGEASRRAAAAGRSLREELAADPDVAAQLSPEELDAALDPRGYLGSARLFVDRALALHARERTRPDARPEEAG
jgi:3-carboxy-cis,cis-muconate cycloisomerase